MKSKELVRIVRPAGDYSAETTIVVRRGNFVNILTHEMAYRSASGRDVPGFVTCVCLDPADAVALARGLLEGAGATDISWRIPSDADAAPRGWERIEGGHEDQAHTD